MEKLGKFLKIVLILAIVCVVVLLAINMYKSGHKELEELVITDNLKTAHTNYSYLCTHKPQNDGFSSNGGLYAYSLAYIEREGYLQVTVRYNKRHMDDIKASYPSFEESQIYFTLSDEAGTVYKPTEIASASKFHYEYFKLEFTGIDFTKEELTLNMVIDVLSDVIDDQSSVLLHKRDQEYKRWELSAEEGTLLSTEISK